MRSTGFAGFATDSAAGDDGEPARPAPIANPSTAMNDRISFQMTAI